MMDETVTIAFKVKIQTEEPTELLRLLQDASFEAALLAEVSDAIRDRLARGKVESQVAKIELRAPQPDGGQIK
ncbi:MAG: hypothetical protein BroJett011_41820 [Chloroflexota bacterium]|nr:MAG: hypothetical protein BroJett011_41820 [Chloroflexota bacterium]